MPELIPGQRYPLTMEMAVTVMRQGWPLVHGTPDLSRGRRFVKPPCSWEFWTTDGRKVSFDFVPGVSCIVSQSKKPDPDRPAPLTEEAK